MPTLSTFIQRYIFIVCNFFTCLQMLEHLREIIQRPDISALDLLWTEGSGPLVDGGAHPPCGAAAAKYGRGGAQLSLSRAASAPAREVTVDVGDQSGARLGGAWASASATSSGSSSVSATSSASSLAGPSRGGGSGPTAPTSTSTAAGWTASRRGIDIDLALLYLLDPEALRILVQRHQQHITAALLPPTGLRAQVGFGAGSVSYSAGGGCAGQSGRAGASASVGVSGGAGTSVISNDGSGAVRSGGSRRSKTAEALHGLRSFARKSFAPKGSGSHSRRRMNGDGTDGDGVGVGVEPPSSSSRSGRVGASGGRSSGGYGELSTMKVAELRQRQQRGAGDDSAFSSLAALVSSPNPVSRREVLSRKGSWDPGEVKIAWTTYSKF